MSNDKLNKMLEKAEKAGKADLSFKGQTVKKAPAKEKRSATIRLNVTPTEKAQFLALIGRLSESDAGRELILAFNKKNKPMEK